MPGKLKHWRNVSQFHLRRSFEPARESIYAVRAGIEKQLPQAVLFDFDLTLADSSKGAIECVNHALCAMDLAPAEQTAIIASIGLPLPRVFHMLTGSVDTEGAADFSRLFVERADQVMTELTVMLPGVPQALHELRASGLRTAIVSTKFRYRIEQILRRERLDQLFDVIVGGEDVKQHKPDPEGLLHALALLNLKPADAVYVGDHAVDAEAARRADLRFIAIPSGNVGVDVFGEQGALEVLNSIDKLPARLRQNL